MFGRLMPDDTTFSGDSSGFPSIFLEPVNWTFLYSLPSSQSLSLGVLKLAFPDATSASKMFCADPLETRAPQSLAAGTRREKGCSYLLTSPSPPPDCSSRGCLCVSEDKYWGVFPPFDIRLLLSTHNIELSVLLLGHGKETTQFLRKHSWFLN